MGTDRERLGEAFSADCSIGQHVGTILGRVGGWDRFRSLPGACSLESEDSEEGGPSGVQNSFVQARLAAGSVMEIAALAVWRRGRTTAEVGGLDRLDMERVVLAHQGQGRLVVEVAPLPPHGLMGLRQYLHRLGAALAALLAPGHPLLALGQIAFC